MALDLDDVAARMIKAAKRVMGRRWSKTRAYAESEMQKLAQTLVMIEQLRLSGKITAEEASLHLQIQKNAARAVLLTLQGLGLLMVEEALNAALKVVKDVVNKAVGFALI